MLFLVWVGESKTGLLLGAFMIGFIIGFTELLEKKQKKTENLNMYLMYEINLNSISSCSPLEDSYHEMAFESGQLSTFP